MVPTPAQSARTFVSYAREDSEFVLKLTADLRQAGANVWLDRFDIPVGKSWPRAVEEALDSSSQFLVVLSPASVRSDNVMAELDCALDEGKRILPVLYRECKRPFRIRSAQYADFTADYQAGLSTLLKYLTVERVLEPPAPEPAAQHLPEPAEDTRAIEALQESPKRGASEAEADAITQAEQERQQRQTAARAAQELRGTVSESQQPDTYEYAREEKSGPVRITYVVVGLFALLAALVYLFYRSPFVPPSEVGRGVAPATSAVVERGTPDALRNSKTAVGTPGASHPIANTEQGTCDICHDEQAKLWAAGKHAHVACETCHGLQAKHATDPTVSTPKLPEVAGLCRRCHEKDAAKPKSFPQVATAEHSGGVVCNFCHKPHNPHL